MRPGAKQLRKSLLDGARYGFLTIKNKIAPLLPLFARERLSTAARNNMLPLYTKNILSEAESIAKTASTSQTYNALRKLPFADFCTLSMAVPPEYPHIKKQLPVMPTDEVQKKWVGDFGQSLMNRTCNIARLIQILSYKTTGSGLEEKKILDYGCGWGRLLRIMNYFTDIENVYGLDVMQSSLDECKRANIPNQFSLCEKRPADLPFGDIQFDLIFAFSVFTHIPEPVIFSILTATRKRISENGVFIITIRSYEFWNLMEGKWPDKLVEKLRSAHESEGYAHRSFENGEEIYIDYGETTMSFDFVKKIARRTAWEVAHIQRDLSEPYQIAIALKPI